MFRNVTTPAIVFVINTEPTTSREQLKDTLESFVAFAQTLAVVVHGDQWKAFSRKKLCCCVLKRNRPDSANMGASVSRNTIENHLSQSLDIASSAIQDCSSGINADQKFIIKAKGDIDLRNINLKQMVTFDSTCVQSTDLENKIDSQLLQHMQQAADSAVKGWGLGFAAASNTTRNYTDLALAITNEFKQNCRNTIQASQVVDLESTEGNVSIDGYFADQTVNAVRDCLQNSKAVSGITNKTVQEVDQKASASVSGLDLGAIVALIVGVIVVVLLVVLMRGGGGGGGNNNSSGGGSGWLIAFLVLFVIAGAAVGAWFVFGSGASSSSTNEETKVGDDCDDKDDAARMKCSSTSDCGANMVCGAGGWCVPNDCSADKCFKGCAARPGETPVCDSTRGIFFCRQNDKSNTQTDTGGVTEKSVKSQTGRGMSFMTATRLF